MNAICLPTAPIKPFGLEEASLQGMTVREFMGKASIKWPSR